jgi:hypothetical protein
VHQVQTMNVSERAENLSGDLLQARNREVEVLA